MTTTDSTTAARHAETWTTFAAWAVDELGCALAFDGSAYRVEHDALREPVEADASGSAIRRRWSLRRQQNATEGIEEEGPLLVASTPLELLEGLVSKLRALTQPPRLRPEGQPVAVHELTERLFAAYTLEGGRAHVAGCHLEEVPFLRRTHIDPADEGKALVSHAFYDAHGRPVPDTLIQELGLNRAQPATDPIPRIDAKLRERLRVSRTEGTDKLLAIVWARRATGQLRFEFGEESVDTPFDGWVRTLEPPPVVCPKTGRETFHLATTEAGQIAAAEAIVVCEATGHRHVEEDLARCAVTGKLVEPEQLVRCPISGEGVLRSEFVSCVRCGESVPRTRATPGGCQGCDAAQRVAAEDPRMMAIVAKHPDLAKRRWNLAETDSSLVLLAVGWFRQHVVTLDQQTLAVRHRAEASRFSSTWRAV